MAKCLRSGFLLILLLLVASILTAQSNEMIDSILAQEVATVGSAAYIALAAAEMISDDMSPERAVVMVVEAGWLEEGAAAEAPTTFGEVAFLLMQAMDVNGGLMYRLIPGPRYAAREFVSMGWSPERRAPSDPISGEFLIRVTGNFLESVEVSP